MVGGLECATLVDFGARSLELQVRLNKDHLSSLGLTTLVVSQQAFDSLGFLDCQRIRGTKLNRIQGNSHIVFGLPIFLMHLFLVC